MVIREKYMMLSNQSFSYTTAKYLNRVFTEDKLMKGASGGANGARRNSAFPQEKNSNDKEAQEKKNDGKSSFHCFHHEITKI